MLSVITTVIFLFPKFSKFCHVATSVRQIVVSDLNWSFNISLVIIPKNVQVINVGTQIVSNNSMSFYVHREVIKIYLSLGPHGVTFVTRVAKQTSIRRSLDCSRPALCHRMHNQNTQ